MEVEASDLPDTLTQSSVVDDLRVKKKGSGKKGERVSLDRLCRSRAVLGEGGDCSSSEGTTYFSPGSTQNQLIE